MSPDRSSGSGKDRAIRLALAAALCAAALGLHAYRKAFIQSLFVRGPGGAAMPSLPAGHANQPALAPVARVRAVLIDGVSAETTSTMPSYDGLCRRGLDMTMDMGFPTVSLPVQSVLWTGLTAQQTGVEYVGELMTPPLSGIPAGIASLAVAENHQYIVHSLGFDEVRPVSPAFADAAGKKQWMETEFAPQAISAIAGPTPLAFVHILRVDSAGHQHGRDSDAYRDAARTADELLGAMIAADGERADTRWFVLADHGHRAAGGHGGEEKSIRLVRACIAGAGITPARPATAIHLVDYSRAIADSLGVAPRRGSAGRPLASALSAPPSLGATLPSPGPLRAALALAAIAIGIAVSLVGSRGRLWGLPWWWLIACVSVVAIETLPTLSVPMIYKPLGRDLYLAALPGLAALAMFCGALLRAPPVRTTLGLLAAPAAFTLAVRILCWRTPPLMPRWTAYTSALMVILLSACGVVALGHFVGCVWQPKSRAR